MIIRSHNKIKADAFFWNTSLYERVLEKFKICQKDAECINGYVIPVKKNIWKNFVKTFCYRENSSIDSASKVYILYHRLLIIY